jgi:short-subunit dehydrogenase
MKTKTIVISWGTKGLWKSIVYALLNDGHKIATFSSNKKNCQNLYYELWNNFKKNTFLVEKCNLTKNDEILQLNQAISEKFWNIDVLINNAWKWYYEYCEQVSIEKFQEIININLVGVARLTQAILPSIRNSGWGQIINISSISGFWSQEKGAFYSATKHGLMWYTKALREEVYKDNIKVATICPGMIDTDFFHEQEKEEIKNRFWKLTLKMLHKDDVIILIKTIINQSATSDIQDIIIKPF